MSACPSCGFGFNPVRAPLGQCCEGSRLTAALNVLEAERREIKEVLGLAAGGVGLTLAQEVRAALLASQLREKRLAEALEKVAADNDPEDGCAHAPDAIEALRAYHDSVRLKPTDVRSADNPITDTEQD